MVLVENATGVFQVDVGRRGIFPGQLVNQLQPGTDLTRFDARATGGVAQSFETLELLVDGLADVIGQPLLGQLLLEIVVVLVVFAEFLADLFQLLAQIEITLHLFGVFLHLVADFAFGLDVMGLVDHPGFDVVDLFADRTDLEKFDFFGDLLFGEKYDHVGQCCGIRQAAHETRGVVGDPGMGLDVLEDDFLERLEFLVV